jgi:hypothetical protein
MRSVRVLVVGATGNVGTAVLRRLAAEPAADVTGVARRVPAPGASVPPPYGVVSRWTACDIGAPESVPRLTEVMTGADADPPRAPLTRRRVPGQWWVCSVSGAPPIIRSMASPPVRTNRVTRTAARTRNAMLSQVV